MSPELQRILAALYERDYGEPGRRARWHATAERLINDALARIPGTSRDEFVSALTTRYLAFRQAQRHPPTLPPAAEKEGAALSTPAIKVAASGLPVRRFSLTPPTATPFAHSPVAG